MSIYTQQGTANQIKPHESPIFREHCHDSALRDDKPPAPAPAGTPATTHSTTTATGTTTPTTTYATTHAATHAATHATPTTTLPILAIGRHGLSVEAPSVRNLAGLADTEPLRTSEPPACMAQRQNVASQREVRLQGVFLVEGQVRNGMMQCGARGAQEEFACGEAYRVQGRRRLGVA